MNTLRSFTVLACAGLTGTHAEAQWIATDLHPAGAERSVAYGVRGVQVGSATFGGVERAGQWDGTAASWSELLETGAASSAAYSVSANPLWLVGVGSFGSARVPHALFWRGTAWEDLHPAGAEESFAWGIWSLLPNVQVGSARFAGQAGRHAMYWSGVANNYVDMHPPEASASEALSYDRAIVGYVVIAGESRAAMFRPSNPWTSLHPANAVRSVATTSGNDFEGPMFQAGSATFGSSEHAGIWRGTSDSWTDLHPSGALSSRIERAARGLVVGSFVPNDGSNLERAGIRFLSAGGSWIDLGAVLPPGFTRSRARGVSLGNAITVVGDASDASGAVHAMQWKLEPPCPQIVFHPLETANPSPSQYSIFAVGAGVLSYEWQVEETPGTWRRISTSPTGTVLPCGARIITDSVSTANLAVYVDPCAAQVDYRFRCVVSNGCGSTPSDPVTQRVCTADLGSLDFGTFRDGSVSIDDLIFFLVEFEQGDVNADLDSDGDPQQNTPDGAVTIEDLLFFLARFEAGC